MWNTVSGNRLLDRRRKEQAHRRHLQALRNIKPLIHNKQPASYSFLDMRLKAKMIKHEREMQIEKSNTLLIEKMIRSSSYIKPTESVFKDSLNAIYKNKLQRQIDTSNQILITKLQSAKSQYGREGMAKSIQNYNRYKSNLAYSRMAPAYDLQNPNNFNTRPSSAYP